MGGARDGNGVQQRSPGRSGHGDSACAYLADRVGSYGGLVGQAAAQINPCDQLLARPGGGTTAGAPQAPGFTQARTGAPNDREIIPPEKLSWSSEFSGGPADQILTVGRFESRGTSAAVGGACRAPLDRPCTGLGDGTRAG